MGNLLCLCGSSFAYVWKVVLASHEILMTVTSAPAEAVRTIECYERCYDN
jgi:hypothetical protein